MPRTAKPAGDGKRYPLNMRTTKEARDQLESAAADSGRSLAQEVEYRLNRSFADDAMFSSPEMRRWAIQLAETFLERGRFEARMNGHTDWTDADLLKDPQVYQSAMFDVFRTMIRQMPEPDRQTIRLYLAQLTAELLGLPGGDDNAR